MVFILFFNNHKITIITNHIVILDKPSYFLSHKRFNRKQASGISGKNGAGGYITTASGILSWEEAAERGNGLSKMQP